MNMWDENRVETGEVELQKVLVGANQILNEWMLEDAILNGTEVDILRNVIMPSLLLTVRKEVLGESLGFQTHTVTQWHPASWWQMFKAEKLHHWWNRWFVQISPVKLRASETTIRWEDIATFPESKIKTPDDLRGPIVVKYRRYTG